MVSLDSADTATALRVFLHDVIVLCRSALTPSWYKGLSLTSPICFFPVLCGPARHATVRAQVVAVSRVWRLLPFLALQVPYWAVYAQMGTAFQNQVPHGLAGIWVQERGVRV